MQTYWAQVFLLPKKIIQMITHTCRVTRDCDTSKAALVDWNTMCIPKTVRGLNMIEFGRWYRATICKLLRALTHKKNTLWVQWIHSFDIKTRNLADMESPSKLLTCQKDVWCRTMAPQYWLYCTLESIFYSGIIQYQEAVLVINYSASQRSMEEPGSSHRNTTKTSVHSLACSTEQTGHSW